jgi:hypothetical protein
MDIFDIYELYLLTYIIHLSLYNPIDSFYKNEIFYTDLLFILFLLFI